jgi:alkaline phosphatase
MAAYNSLMIFLKKEKSVRHQLSPKITAGVWGLVLILLWPAPLPAAGQSSVLKLNALTDAQARAVGVRNVILMIPDGMGSAHATVGRWYKFAKTGVNRLSFDDLACGMVRTYWSTGLITDSAPAASAMATGFKTSAGFIGLRPAKTAMPGLPELLKGDESTPVASILEAARLQGRSTGLVVTCQFPHATPAGFSSHYIQRNAMDLLAEQQVYLGMDVVLGGGRKYLDPAARKDKEDLVKVLRERGYLYVTDRDGLQAAKAGKLWGAFAETAMERDLDRDLRMEPSLTEMTVKALDILGRNRKGFFLMVEGSQVDWGGHANDPIGTVTEILAFDQAVQAVLDFARRDGETAVIIAADHSTGGMNIGTPEIGDMSVAKFAEVVLKAKATPTKIAQRLTEGPPPSLDEAKGLIAGLLGISDLQPAETAALAGPLKERSMKKLELELGHAVSRRVGIGWVFTGHGGEDITLYVHHPRDMRIGGVVQNTDIALYMARLLGANLGVATGRLFAPAGREFAAAGATVSVDAADPENPVFQAVRGGHTLRLAVNKSLADLDGRIVPLDGVVVCTALIPGPAAADPKVWFVPRAAVDLLK